MSSGPSKQGRHDFQRCPHVRRAPEPPETTEDPGVRGRKPSARHVPWANDGAAGLLHGSSARDRLVSEAGDLRSSLLDDHQVEHRDVARDDAAAHRLAVPLALPHAVTPAALRACVGEGAARSAREAVLVYGHLGKPLHPSTMPDALCVHPEWGRLSLSTATGIPPIRCVGCIAVLPPACDTSSSCPACVPRPTAVIPTAAAEAFTFGRCLRHPPTLQA